MDNFLDSKGRICYNISMLDIKDSGNKEIKFVEKTNKSRIKSERASIVSEFVQEINKERIGSKYKPVTGRMIAVKLSHLKDNGTLYYFLSVCRDYKNRGGAFSKCFWGSLKVRPEVLDK